MVLTQSSERLPLRSKGDQTQQQQLTSEASVAIHDLPAHNGALLRVTPPTAPPTMPEHIPCDIVLVIDVSYSMGADAQKAQSTEPNAGGGNGNDVVERDGLSLLDLVKHAVRTVMEPLDKSDRVGIVTFSDEAEVVSPLLPMTRTNKKKAQENIQSMQPDGCTNMWHGMLKAVEMFDGETHSGRVPSIMLLTDGRPNTFNPAQGFIKKMRLMEEFNQPVPIHTFGFGYELDSGLLKSISEYTGGLFAFIPDSGMLGTIFIHAVANMQSTFATEASLQLTYPKDLEVQNALGSVVKKELPQLTNDTKTKTLNIPLGSIQFGQTRDVFIDYNRTLPEAEAGKASVPSLLRVQLNYHRMQNEAYQSEAQCMLGDDDDGTVDKDYDFAGDDETLDGQQDVNASELTNETLSDDEIAFHIVRTKLFSFLMNLYPVDAKGSYKFNFTEYMERKPDYLSQLNTFMETLKSVSSSSSSEHPMCAALLADVESQGLLALSDTYVRTGSWGTHYLLSLHSAHASQQCSSFKDEAVQLYGAHSPQFIACRNALDLAFDTLPPPKPSNLPPPQRGGRRGNGCAAAVPAAPVPMRQRYRNAAAGCFAGSCRVAMADPDRTVLPVSRLRRGMFVLTPCGPRAVAAVLKTPVHKAQLVALGRLLITPWHPVSCDGGNTWEFPCHTKKAAQTSARSICYTGSIYSVLLQPDSDVDAHALSIEGSWVVSLGHGLTNEEEDDDDEVVRDVRVHNVFGDYAKVCRALSTLKSKRGVYLNQGPSTIDWKRLGRKLDPVSNQRLLPREAPCSV